VVLGIVAGRVLGEGAGRTVLEALIDGQDHHLARAGQRAGVEQTIEIGERPGTVATGWSRSRLLSWADRNIKWNGGKAR
jgi:hypothetical protein